jgi:hypothetical protein
VSDVGELAISANDAGYVYEACTLRRDGAVWCWSAQTEPSAMARRDLPAARHLVAGDGLTCALLTSGRIRCWTPWGDPVEIDGIEGATSVEVRSREACAVDGRGAVSCWTGTPNGMRPRSLDEARGAEQLALGWARSYPGVSVVPSWSFTSHPEGGTRCALRGGAAACWGPNYAGTVGDGTREARARPVPLGTIDGRPLEGVAQIAIGLGLACARLEDGSVWCWGTEGDDLFGGELAQAARPRPVAGVSDVVQVTAGYNHVCALTSKGAVLCWGGNRFGALGPATERKYEPRPVPLLW